MLWGVCVCTCPSMWGGCIHPLSMCMHGVLHGESHGVCARGMWADTQGVAADSMGARMRAAGDIKGGVGWGGYILYP